MSTAHYQSWLASGNPDLAGVGRRMIEFVENGCSREKSADVRRPLLDPRVIKFIRDNKIQPAEHYAGYVTAAGVKNTNPSEERTEHDTADEEVLVHETPMVFVNKTAREQISELRAETDKNSPSSEAGDGCEQKTAPAFISDMNPKFAGRVEMHESEPEADEYPEDKYPTDYGKPLTGEKAERIKRIRESFYGKNRHE